MLAVLPPALLSSTSAPQALVAGPVSTAVSSSAAVPFYSQFRDISSPKWQKVGCGIASLAMLIDYYDPSAVSVDTLLAQGIKDGAYSDAGWSHSGLVALSKKYGLTGTTYDLSSSSSASALSKLQASLSSGPVIASVHYKLDPKNPIPHLVVVTAIKNNTVYYNDPANKSGQSTISVADFSKAWKQRYIVIRPSAAKLALAPHSSFDTIMV